MVIVLPKPLHKEKIHNHRSCGGICWKAKWPRDVRKNERREAEDEWERKEDSWWQNGGSRPAAVSVNGSSMSSEHLFSLSLSPLHKHPLGEKHYHYTHTQELSISFSLIPPLHSISISWFGLDRLGNQLTILVLFNFFYFPTWYSTAFKTVYQTWLFKKTPLLIFRLKR